MPSPPSDDQNLILAIAAGWNSLERRLDGATSSITGISFAEYRLLRCLADAPGGHASRVDLADTVGMTSSGVTRALRPLEKLGVAETTRSERDARLALASLTAAGRELVETASGVVDDVARQLFERSPDIARNRAHVLQLMEDIAGLPRVSAR